MGWAIVFSKLAAAVQYEVHLEDTSHDAISGTVLRDKVIIEKSLVLVNMPMTLPPPPR